jgi:hypothetical protein
MFVTIKRLDHPQDGGLETSWRGGCDEEQLRGSAVFDTASAEVPAMAPLSQAAALEELTVIT